VAAWTVTAIHRPASGTMVGARPATDIRIRGRDGWKPMKGETACSARETWNDLKRFSSAVRRVTLRASNSISVNRRFRVHRVRKLETRQRASSVLGPSRVGGRQ